MCYLLDWCLIDGNAWSQSSFRIRMMSLSTRSDGSFDVIHTFTPHQHYERLRNDRAGRMIWTVAMYYTRYRSMPIAWYGYSMAKKQVSMEAWLVHSQCQLRTAVLPCHLSSVRQSIIRLWLAEQYQLAGGFWDKVLWCPFCGWYFLEWWWFSCFHALMHLYTRISYERKKKHLKFDRVSNFLIGNLSSLISGEACRLDRS